MKRYYSIHMRGLLTVTGHIAVFTLASVIAGAWANELLHVSQRAAELVLAPADLQQLVAEQESSLTGEAADAAAQPPQGDPLKEPPAVKEQASDASQDAAVTETQRDASTDVAVPQNADVDQPPEMQDARSDATGSKRHQGSEPLDKLSDGTTRQDGELQLRAGQTGSLSSFTGEGLAAGGDAPAESGQGSGLYWNVQLSQAPSAWAFQSIDGLQLAAARQRRGFVEIAVIDGHSVQRPVSVQDFLAAHPHFSIRRGIVLDGRWLINFQDRLLSYGGGWQLWLLVDDDLFRLWTQIVGDQLRMRGLALSDVAHIEARLDLPRRGHAGSTQFRVMRIEPKAVGSAEPTVDGQAAAPPSGLPTNSPQE